MAAPRKTAAARVKAAADDFVEMCAEHFPHGWRHVAEHQDAVACEHGEWTRPAEAEPETPPAPPPPPVAPEAPPAE